MPAVATTIEPFALSPREAAKCLAVSKRTISRLITARKIVARKVGSRTLVDVASLNGYYESLRLKAERARSRQSAQNAASRRRAAQAGRAGRSAARRARARGDEEG